MTQERVPLMEWERRIGRELDRIAKQLKAGNNTELATWVVPDILAASQRPLRYDPRFRDPVHDWHYPLPPDAKTAVAEWLDQLQRDFKIRSVICLMEFRDLRSYYEDGGLALHADGLLGFYRSRGLVVSHTPLSDYQRPKQAKRQEVYGAFERLPGPVLVHCSAGADRTTPVAAYIAYKIQ